MNKILTVVGTRPELIKMSTVIKTLGNYTEHILVHTGQNYAPELNRVFFKDLDIPEPDYYLNVASEAGLPIATISNVLLEVDRILEIEKPNAVLYYGDTNSCLSIIAAKKRRIPTFHMEAGNRCFDQRVPEEVNRKIIDHLADVNMTLTGRAREYLVAEGLRPDHIFHIGSHMDEVIFSNLDKITASKILETLAVESKSYFLASLHREENVDDSRSLQRLIQTLDRVSTEFNKKCILSLHPRTRKRLASISDNVRKSQRIIYCDPFSFTDYIALQLECFCLLSDSGTISEESRILGMPSVALRDAHERPEGIEDGSFSLGARSISSLIPQIRLAVSASRRSIEFDQKALNVSSKIAKIVLGYVDRINSEVWKENPGNY